MRNLLHFVARLYPQAWRERYGDEFAALVEDLRPQWKDLFDILRGGIIMQLARLNPVTVVAASVLLSGIAIASLWYATPAKWRSEAVVAVRSRDGRPISKDLVAELSQRAFSNGQLGSLIARYDLYPTERAHRPISDVIESAKRDITIRFEESDPNAFLVSFTYKDPSVAQRVVSQLLTLLVEENFRIAFLSQLQIRAPANLPQLPIRPAWLVFIAYGVGGAALLGMTAVWFTRRGRAIVR